MFFLSVFFTNYKNYNTSEIFERLIFSGFCTSDHIFSCLYHDLWVFFKVFLRNNIKSLKFWHLVHGVFWTIYHVFRVFFHDFRAFFKGHFEKKQNLFFKKVFSGKKMAWYIFSKTEKTWSAVDLWRKKHKSFHNPMISWEVQFHFCTAAPTVAFFFVDFVDFG